MINYLYHCIDCIGRQYFNSIHKQLIDFREQRKIRKVIAENMMNNQPESALLAIISYAGSTDLQIDMLVMKSKLQYMLEQFDECILTTRQLIGNRK